MGEHLALEEQCMALISGIHRQITLDRQESDRLAEGASNRLSTRIHECEQRQQWFDCRMAELSISISDISTEQQVQRHRVDLFQEALDRRNWMQEHAETKSACRNSELKEDQRNLAVAVCAAATPKNEFQRQNIQKLSPIEDGLVTLEDNQRNVGETPTLQHPDGAGGVHSGTLLAVRDLEASVLDELRIVHARCDLLQRVIRGEQGDEMEPQRSDDTSQMMLGSSQEDSIDDEVRMRSVQMDSPAHSSRRLAKPLQRSHTVDVARDATNGIRVKLDFAKNASSIQESCTQSRDDPSSDLNCESQIGSDQSESYSTSLALVSRVSACEAAQRELQRHFTECSVTLGQRIQHSFSDVRGHLDTVMQRLGELNERVQRQEEVWLNGDANHERYTLLTKRMEELDDCVRQNAAVAVPLCSNVVSMQESLADVKQSINMALLERRSAIDSSSSSMKNVSVGGLGIDQTACASIEACAGTVCSSNSTTGPPAEGHLLEKTNELHEQVSSLAHRTACVEGSVANMDESLATLSAYLFGRKNLLPSQPTTRDLLPELTVATPASKRGSSCLGGLTSSKHAIEGLASRASESCNAWAQADAVLEVVEGIVSRQQHELSKLTASLHLQSSIQVKTPLTAKLAAASEALDTSEPCSKVTTTSAESCDRTLLRVHHGCNEEQSCLEAGTAMMANVPDSVLKAADAADAMLLVSDQKSNDGTQSADKTSQ